MAAKTNTAQKCTYLRSSPARAAAPVSAFGDGVGERNTLLDDAEAGVALISRLEDGFDDRLRLRGLRGLRNAEGSVISASAGTGSCGGSTDVGGLVR